MSACVSISPTPMQFTQPRVVRRTMAVALVLFVGIFFGSGIAPLAVVLMILAAGSLFVFSAPQQLLILENARGGEMLGAALVQVAFNLGNAAGAYFGGLPIEYGLNSRYTALPAMAFMAAGLVVTFIYAKKYPRHAPR